MKSLLPLLTLSTFLLFGCTAIKPSATKSGKNYFETFYVGDDGTQYFIKPLAFESTSTDLEMVMDFTFRYKNEIKDSALIKLSLIGPEMYKSVQGVQWLNEPNTIEAQSVELMFNEKKKRGFASRFSTAITLKELHTLFSDDDWQIKVQAREQTLHFTPTKKSRKAIITLRDKVFILM